MPRATKKAFLRCVELPWLQDSSWYLAGGTALALQVGHRVSVDLDFFTEEKDFSVEEMERLLMSSGEWTTTLIERGRCMGFLKARR